MGKLKRIFKNKRVIILIIFLVLAVFLINPIFSDGIAIRGVAKDSAASMAEPNPIVPPDASTRPTGREVIKSVNGIQIHTVKDYFSAIEGLEINDTITIQTNKERYFITIQPNIKTINLNETETVLVNKTVFNETTNSTETIEVYETVNKTKTVVNGTQPIGLNVYDRPTNNIQQGLDLQGGTRVFLRPVEEATQEDLDIAVENIQQRLDVYGVSDVTVRTTSDFFGNTFISVEIAGVSEEEIKDLITQQGKFEAKVGDTVVFGGGDRDILNVCRSSTCGAQLSKATCQQGTDNQWFCSFRFPITLSQNAAQNQAAATANLDVVSSPDGQGYLSENLSLYLDDELMDQLRIGASLKGNAVTDISISGSGEGDSLDAAHEDAFNSMKQLQTILLTGSLPVKLEVATTDTISPVLGQDFIKNAVLAGVIAAIVVILVVMIRYKEWKVSIPMALTMLSEVIILLGFASLIGWKIDLIAVAAIIIAIGSGVDDQIVITDETLSRNKNKKEDYDWKTKLKKAFFIIMAAYFTLVVAMIPLMFAGAGLLFGFALTTIAGVTVGVLVTRPAFAAILEILVE